MKKTLKDFVAMAKRERRLRWRGQVKAHILDMHTGLTTDVVVEIIPAIGQKITVLGWQGSPGASRIVTDVAHQIAEDYHQVHITVDQIPGRPAE